MELTRSPQKFESASKYQYIGHGDSFRLADENHEDAGIYMRIDTGNVKQKLSVNLASGVARTFKPDTRIVYVDVKSVWGDDE